MFGWESLYRTIKLGKSQRILTCRSVISARVLYPFLKGEKNVGTQLVVYNND